MNQVNNRIPFGLLIGKDKDQFCGEAKRRELYEDYNSEVGWHVSKDDAHFSFDVVYRLIIKDDEWYTFIVKGNPHGDSQDDNIYILQGKDVKETDFDSYDIIRPATPAEIEAAKPKELSMEDGAKEALSRCLLKLDDVSNELAQLIEECK
jgi:hypothetical protein